MSFPASDQLIGAAGSGRLSCIKRLALRILKWKNFKPLRRQRETTQVQSHERRIIKEQQF